MCVCIRVHWCDCDDRSNQRQLPLSFIFLPPFLSFSAPSFFFSSLPVRCSVCVCVFRYIHLCVCVCVCKCEDVLLLREIKCCGDFKRDSHRQPLNSRLHQRHEFTHNPSKLKEAVITIYVSGFPKMVVREFNAPLEFIWCVSCYLGTFYLRACWEHSYKQTVKTTFVWSLAGWLMETDRKM